MLGSISDTLTHLPLHQLKLEVGSMMVQHVQMVHMFFLL